MAKLSRIWKEFRKKDRTKDYVRFSICQNIVLDIEANYTELPKDELLRILTNSITPYGNAEIHITEPKMKVLSRDAVHRLVGIWKHNIKKKSRLDYGHEGPVYRFLGLIRGDETYNSIAMGLAWLNRAKEWGYSASVDLSATDPGQEMYEIEGLHVLNFFVYRYGDFKVLWVEPQTGEMMEKLTQYRPKLVIL